jgi:hypothetical protein
MWTLWTWLLSILVDLKERIFGEVLCLSMSFSYYVRIDDRIIKETANSIYRKEEETFVSWLLIEDPITC